MNQRNFLVMSITNLFSQLQGLLYPCPNKDLVDSIGQAPLSAKKLSHWTRTGCIHETNTKDTNIPKATLRFHLAPNYRVSFNITDSWGYRGENGSWSGMIGMLERREVDIGGTTTFFIPQRIGVVQYIQLYTRTK